METNLLGFIEALTNFFDEERKKSGGRIYTVDCERIHTALIAMLVMLRHISRAQMRDLGTSNIKNLRVNISHAFGPFGRIKIESRPRR